MQKGRWFATAMGMLACIAPAMSATAQTSAEWDAVIAAAKAEGEVTLYTGITGGRQHPQIAKLFEEKYGIKVQILDGSGSQTMSRIQAEVTANRTIGDVVLIGSTGTVPMVRAGQVVAHGGIPNLKKKMTFQVDVPEEVPVFVNPYGLVVNTSMVPEADQPKSWLDLLDPKWKGKILSYRLNATGSGATWFGVMQDAFGTEFHEKLAKQNPVFTNELREAPRRVARGEYPIYLPFTLTEIIPLEGLPVKAIVPKEGIAYTPFTMGLLKGAPHPNAARLLMNFFLEPEAQLVYARDGYPVAIEGLQAQTPENRRWSVNAKLLGRQKLDGMDERMRLAEKIFDGK